MAKWMLPGILVLSILLRIVGLSAHPVGFTPDEASFGYDAFSLLQTGKDQWGNPWPLVLKSFGDAKMPLYTYLAMPSIALFGLTETATRLPNALFGVLAVIATYLLAKKAWNKNIGLLSAFLLAISPWHIMLSRGAFEANLTTFFLTISIHFFLVGLKKQKYLLLAVLFAGLNLFTYHAARFVTPLIFIVLLFEYRKVLSLKNKYSLLAGIIAAIFVSFVAITYLQGAGNRVATSGIFALANQAGDIKASLVNAGAPDTLTRMFFNKPLSFLAIAAKNYAQYFSPQFLFTNGPAEWTYGMIVGQGVLYLFELVLLVGFFIALVMKKIGNNKWLVAWILIAPIPAALTIGPGYAANRAAIIMPALSIAAALGGRSLYAFLHDRFKKIALAGFIGVACLSLISFLFSYIHFQKVFGAPGMIYGARPIFEYLSKNGSTYDDIIISKKLSEPHIYAAFYDKIDPSVVQAQSVYWDFDKRGLSWVDQLPQYSLEKYEFTNIDWQQVRTRKNTLVIGTPSDFPWDVQPHYIFNYPDKKPAYYVIDTNTLQ